MNQMAQFLKTVKRRKALLQVTKSYHTINKQGKTNERNLAEFPSKNRQLLLDLIEQCQWACDQLMDITGRAAIKAALQLSVGQVSVCAARQQQQDSRRFRSFRSAIRARS
jgi:hypothetical protein